MRIIAFFALLLVPALANGQTFGGIGVRAEGMGGAFVAVADDASAVYWNPAGVATGSTFDFQISRVDREIGSGFLVGATLPVVGLSYYRTHTVQGGPDRQTEGSEKVPIGAFQTSNFGVTFVQSIVPSVVIGTTLRVVSGGFEDSDSDTKGDLDAGVMVSLAGIRAGVSARNLAAPDFDGPLGTVELERQVRVGAAYAPRSAASGAQGPMTASFDVDITETQTFAGDLRMAAIGGEYWAWSGLLGVRGGVRWNTLDMPATAWSTGLTVRLPRAIHAEGHLTIPHEDDRDPEWGIGVRVTF